MIAGLAGGGGVAGGGGGAGLVGGGAREPPPCVRRARQGKGDGEAFRKWWRQLPRG